MSRTAVTLAVAALLVTAGCTGVLPGGGGGGDAETGTVAFYVSDQPGAIDDFRHLNVTITRVGFHPANASENESWVTRDIEDRTVDLTELQGANASLLGNVSVPAGTYDKTFAYVSEVEGVLKTGERVNVKLPSQKLHLNADVTVADGETVRYVYDVMVTKAGKSGKYVIRPVVNQSGTDVPIDPVRRGGDGQGAGGEAGPRQLGTLDVFVSDRPTEIDDFRHLNVTITRVRVFSDPAFGTGNWTAYDISSKTVDLTRVTGDRAVLLASLDLPAREYTKIAIRISDVNATLVDGSHPDVIAAGRSLQLAAPFVVPPDGTASFVYDVGVHEFQNGTYVVRPQFAASGTDEPIDRVELDRDE